jgi:hypothetical protein
MTIGVGISCVTSDELDHQKFFGGLLTDYIVRSVYHAANLTVCVVERLVAPAHLPIVTKRAPSTCKRKHS